VRDTTLLYDGLCGFCDGVVQFVLARDTRGTLRFAPLQGEFARGVLERHPGLLGMDSLVLVTGEGASETVSVRSDAALDVAAYLGGIWSLARVLRAVPRPLRDWGYDLFARYRYRLFGRRTACRIPEPAVRARFLA
jgi:predicted DCC family thiol-disulfide oxidoreductase YuxK